MPSILIVGPSWVGDMVMAQSLFKELVQQQPDTSIDVLAPAWSKALLARMPEVSGTIEMPMGHGQLQLARRYRLGRALRSKGYSQVIVLPNSFKSALVPYWAKIPKRTGYTGEMRWGLLNDARKLDKQKLTMTVQRFVALASAAENQGFPVIQPPKLCIDPGNVKDALDRLGMEKPGRPVLAICPGAEFGSAKRWPQEYYAEVAIYCIQQGWQVWIFGSDRDILVADKISGTVNSNYCTSLAGKTALEDAIDLMSLADVVVSNDSGLMHVAAALDRKLIAVYGSSDPGFTPPLNQQASILSLGLDCSPCFRRECPPGHLNCLRDLKPERVIKLITANSPPPIEGERIED
ncbi:MAG TPA: lipopolysaccharide heptosyltransferase II [Gammaproteobacteria bacterium]|nr:lipopolysaccharide heptosyltransferase II [Gammaproteobacteria bacterium]